MGYQSNEKGKRDGSQVSISLIANRFSGRPPPDTFAIDTDFLSM